jgi:AraC-like DNA-binding protein
LLIYYLGFTGYYQPDYIAIYNNLPVNNGRMISFPKEEIENARGVIIHELEINKIYLDQNVNINSLAEKTKLSPALISTIINRQFGKNFRNMINEYRVEEVKTKLADPKFQHLSILGIALEAGFNAEASFYRSFKKCTGISPSDYLNSKKTTTKPILKSV